MQNKKQQLELDMEQQTGSKLGKEFVKAVYCHLAYLTYMQYTSCEMSGWMNHKLESRLLGEISTTSDSVLYHAHPCMKCSLDISTSFFEENSSLSHPIVFLSSLHCSFGKAFSSFLATLWNFAFSWVYFSLSPLPFISLLSSAICKASSDNYFAFLHFFFFGMVLVAASYTMLQTSVHSSLVSLSTVSNPLNLFITSAV